MQELPKMRQCYQKTVQQPRTCKYLWHVSKLQSICLSNLIMITFRQLCKWCGFSDTSVTWKQVHKEIMIIVSSGYWGPFLGAKCSQGVTLSTHLYLVPRLRISLSYTPTPPSVYMVCSGTASFFNIWQFMCYTTVWPPPNTEAVSFLTDNSTKEYLMLRLPSYSGKCDQSVSGQLCIISGILS